jgi:membrane-bound serine protease (ClpP class)
VSAIRKLFRATAEQHGRPPEAAEAMVDADVAIPALVEKGKLLRSRTIR